MQNFGAVQSFKWEVPSPPFLSASNRTPPQTNFAEPSTLPRKKIASPHIWPQKPKLNLLYIKDKAIIYQQI